MFSRTFAWIAAASAALCLSTAAALGLGDIDVKSRLNQPLSAIIPMTSVSPDDAEAVQVSLASNDEFERAGIERAEYLSSLRFSVVTDGGKPRIVISSKQSAHEPYLSFLLEVRSKSSRSLREYTILLDPPDFAAPAPAPAVVAKAEPKLPPAPASQFYETPEEKQQRVAPPATTAMPAAPVTAAPQSVMPPPAPAVSAPIAAPAAVPAPAKPVAPAPAPLTPTTGYGPVQQKETLWSVATKLRPDPSISMDQVQLAIYKSNPKAFDGFQGLRKGVMLNVPSIEQMREVGPDAAKARIAELRGMPAPKPAAPAAAQPAVVPPPAVSAPIVPPPAEKPKHKAEKPVEKPLLADKPLVPPPPMPEKKPSAAEKKVEPLVPPPAVQVPVPPPATASKPATPAPAAEPAVAVPPPPAPAATTPAEPAAAVTSDQPLIPATPAPAPQPVVTPPPAQETPQPEPESSGSGMFLWLAIVAVLLGAGGFLGFRFWKARQEALENGEEAPSFIPSARLRKKDSAAAAFAAVPKAAAGDFDDEPEIGATQPADRMHDTLADTSAGLASRAATQSFAATSETPINRFESTLSMSTGQSYNANATVETSVDRTLKQAPSAERVDFDVTSQFAAETMSINLDANDPVSEADFHLAYGLYDEAALLLKQAADKDPGRTDVRVKLAETYFAASRPAEFEQVAQSLQNQLPEPEWQKLALMGRQLCPDSPIFAGADDGALGGDIDLSFDEPVTPHQAAPAAAPAPRAAPAPAPAADIGLDFKLEELELPKIEEPMLEMPASLSAAPAPAAPAAGGSSGNTLDFKLDNIDFNATSPGTSAGFTPSPATAPASFDMETVALNTHSDMSEVKLDDFDLNEASTAISSGDEAGTKLDLARAYADMGDNDMARTLLKEVAAQGNPEQQREAQSLMGRLA